MSSMRISASRHPHPIVHTSLPAHSLRVGRAALLLDVRERDATPSELRLGRLHAHADICACACACACSRVLQYTQYSSRLHTSLMTHRTTSHTHDVGRVGATLAGHHRTFSRWQFTSIVGFPYRGRARAGAQILEGSRSNSYIIHTRTVVDSLVQLYQ